jgi:uncharacterized OsmC-like protein
VVSLAACIAFYVRRFLERHDLSTDGLSIEATFTMAPRAARVSEIDVSVCVPRSVPQEQLGRLLAVASHCTVHNSLEDPPDIRIGLNRPSHDHRVAAGP